MMPFNFQYITWPNSISLWDDDGEEVLVNGAPYSSDKFNTNNPGTSSFYDWNAIHVDSNGLPISGNLTARAVDVPIFVPWRLPLEVIPLNTNGVRVSISVPVDGSPYQVDAVATSNIASLSGAQTIDGVSLSSTDRVLLTAQTNETENGIWVVAGGSWTRPSEMTAASTIDLETRFNVMSIGGNSYSNTFWYMANVSNPVVGTDGITFERKPAFTEIPYIFNALFYSPNQLTIRSYLRASTSAEVAFRTTVAASGGRYTASRSNSVTVSPGIYPTAAYSGGPVTMLVDIIVDGHGGVPFYMTCPFLYQEYQFAENPFNRALRSYIPGVYFDVDETSEDAHAMRRFFHALTYGAAKSNDMYLKYFKYDENEISPQYSITERWTRSELVDVDYADNNYLEWLGQIVGTEVARNIYPVNPADATKTMGQAARVVAASNLDLSGAETIDGKSVEDGHRVLAIGQSTPSQNGLYSVSTTGSWTRVSDMASGLVISLGAEFSVLVLEGGTYEGSIWKLDTTSAKTVGTDALTFSMVQAGADYVSVSNLDLTGAETIDGTAVPTGTRVLVTGQTTASQNGIYSASTSGSWTRVVDMSSGSLAAGYKVFINGGNIYGGTLWKLQTTGTIGSSSLNFQQTYGTVGYEADEEEFARWQINNKYFGLNAGSTQAIEDILDRYLTGGKYRELILTGFRLSIKTLYSETPWAAHGRSPLLETVLELTRPAGYTLETNVVYEPRFTLNSPTLGQLGTGGTADPLG